MSAPTVGSLFSGIEGLGLGLVRAGFRLVWQSEIDPYCIRVNEKNWPGVPNLGDVREVDWSTVERVDLICGGYPCQPFSIAGYRKGSDDERHLWPYFVDAIRNLRPRFALLENVPGHLSLGFDRVLVDLAELGFDADWSLVPASGVGAPHRRDRLFTLAWANEARPLADAHAGHGGHSLDEVRAGRDAAVDGRAIMALTSFPDVEGPMSRHPGQTSWSDRWAEPRGSRRGESRPGRWLPEPAVDRMADGVPRSVVRAPLEALGNAVVPQVAQFIGEQLLHAISAQNQEAQG